MKKLIATPLVAILALLLVASSALADYGPQTGPVDPSQTRYSGYVYDLETGAGVEWVCVYAGPAGCPNPGLRTDARGYWAIDLPTGFSWDFHFGGLGYYQADIPSIGPRSVVVLVPTTGYSSGSTGVTVKAER